MPMFCRSTLALLICGIAYPHCASSQQPSPTDLALARLEGTTSVSYSPTFSNGQIIGCGIEFNAVARDWSFRKGEYDKISGSFGFLISNKNIAPILKLVVNELDRGTFSFRPKAPTRAYVTAGTLSNFQTLITSYQSDTPGSLFSVFQIEPTANMYAQALVAGKLSLRYGKNAAGIDAPIEIDLTVVDTKDDGMRVKSDKPVDDMLSCVRHLLDVIR